MGKELLKEANEIANAEFGDDADKRYQYLENLRVHTYGCGCGACKRQFEKEVSEYIHIFWRVQGEDSNF